MEPVAETDRLYARRGALDNDQVSRGPGRLTISIVDGVAGVLAPKQQERTDEIRRPGCVDRVEVVVRRDGVGIRVQPFVGRGGRGGKSCCTGSGGECRDEKKKSCDTACPRVRGRASPDERAHRTGSEDPDADGAVSSTMRSGRGG